MYRQSNFNAKSANVYDFSMVPRPDVPRSRFKQSFTHKSTFDADYLVPIYLDEVLPGDTFNLNATLFIRMQTPVVPILDNIHFDTFFFFVPYRLLWDDWEPFITGVNADNVGNKLLIPQLAWGAPKTIGVSTLGDYMGLPTIALQTGQSISVSALPFVAYNLIYNEWFRDENLIKPVPVNTQSGFAHQTQDYVLLKRGKRHDYFTSALPWPQKNGASQNIFGSFTTAPITVANPNGSGPLGLAKGAGAATPLFWNAIESQNQLYADLSQATNATINNLRLAFATGRLLERDARGGTRYVETLRAHFGVNPPDSRLQRPEYLGGGTTHLNMSPVPQTSATQASGSTTPLGQLGGIGTAVGRHGFTKSFVEHGIVIGLINARADLTYQQGIPRWFFRKTRYDFYWPAFAYLGEQTILRQEIYVTGTPQYDQQVFGYQERWAEYRHHLSTISGYFQSGIPGTLDYWHLAQYFNGYTPLGKQFIESETPMTRVLAAGSKANGLQFLLDSAWINTCARPMPMYSVPGNLDRF